MIKDYMSRNIIVVSRETTIVECANIMKQYDIGFLPVSNGNKIIGVITDRDIVINTMSNFASIDSKIDKYITKNICAIDSHEDVKTALGKMGANKIKRLLVTELKKVVGVISLSDLINTSNCDELLETIREILEISNISNDFHTEIDEFYL